MLKARLELQLLLLKTHPFCLVPPLDLEYEEERGRCSEEEAKDKCSSDSSPKRYSPFNSSEFQ